MTDHDLTTCRKMQIKTVLEEAEKMVDSLPSVPDGQQFAAAMCSFDRIRKILTGGDFYDYDSQEWKRIPVETKQASLF